MGGYRGFLGCGILLAFAGSQMGGCSFTQHSPNPMMAAPAAVVVGSGGGSVSTPPAVTTTAPAAGATGVAISVIVNVTFSTTMNSATITSSNLFLYTTSATSPVPATVTYNPSTMTAMIQPAATLSPNTLYTLEVTTSVMDSAGMALAANHTSTFTTGSAVVTTPPVFGGATSAVASSSTAIQVTWSPATDQASPTGILYDAYISTTTSISFTAPYATSAPDATSMTLTGLAPATTYYIVIRARDQSGNSSTNTAPISATTLAATTSAVSFSSQVYPALKSSCGMGGCHDGGQFPPLNQATASLMYSGIVNQNSGGRYTGAKLIDGAGASTSNSEIWNALRQNGGSMPQGGTYSTTDLNNLKAWIQAGAPNN